VLNIARSDPFQKRRGGNRERGAGTLPAESGRDGGATLKE